jgi:hypothetical protein
MAETDGFGLAAATVFVIDPAARGEIACADAR